MQYREYQPSAPLRSIVQCLWTLEGSASGLNADTQPVLPDGRPELIVHFGDPFSRVHPDGSVERQPAVLFAGQLTRSMVLQPAGRVAVLGVRFHSHGAAALLPQSQRDFVDCTIDVGAASGRLARAIDEVPDSARSLTDARTLIESRLAQQAQPARVDHSVRFAVNAIHRCRGQVAIERLAAHAGVTRRQLERRFNDLVGLSPKRLARIARLQHAMYVLNDVRPGGAAVAAICGYADQAHFVRECRELGGYTPTSDLLQRAELTRFFLDDSRR